MGLALAGLGRGLAQGVLDSKKLKLQLELDELARQRQLQDQQTQQGFASTQARLSRGAASNENAQSRVYNTRQNELNREHSETQALSAAANQMRLIAAQSGSKYVEGDLNQSAQNLAQHTLEQQELQQGYQAEVLANQIRETDARLIQIQLSSQRGFSDNVLGNIDSAEARELRKDQTLMSTLPARDRALIAFIDSTGKNPLDESLTAPEAADGVRSIVAAQWELALIENGISPEISATEFGYLPPETRASVTAFVNASTVESPEFVKLVGQLTGHDMSTLVDPTLTEGDILDAVDRYSTGVLDKQGMSLQEQQLQQPNKISVTAKATDSVFSRAMEHANIEGYDLVLAELRGLLASLERYSNGPAIRHLIDRFGDVAASDLPTVIAQLEKQQMIQQQMMQQLQQPNALARPVQMPRQGQVQMPTGGQIQQPGGIQ